MADRRMFSRKIIDSDAFLDMSLSTQALYFHLSMRADDEGFVNNPRKIQRMISATEDELKVLITKNYIIPFESGIVVIKHWKLHNLIQKDRFHSTVYTSEKALLEADPTGVYQLKNQSYTNCIHSVSEVDTQVSIGKASIGKANIDKGSTEGERCDSSGRYMSPTLKEVTAYCLERQNNIDPQRFIDYYEAKGCKGRDWKVCIRTWESDDRLIKLVTRKK